MPVVFVRRVVEVDDGRPVVYLAARNTAIEKRHAPAALERIVRPPHRRYNAFGPAMQFGVGDRKSTRLNSSHLVISYAVFCLKKKITIHGHADVMWASDHGRAGLLLSHLARAARKHFKNGFNKRTAHSKNRVIFFF